MAASFSYQPKDIIQDRWQVIRPLGAGRTKVYLATDHAAETDVVLRFPTRWSTAVNESLRANSIPRHPYLCYLHEVRMIERHPMQVFDYVPGGTLEDKIIQGLANEAFLLRTCLAVCDGLSHLNFYGISYHGDLKPSNLLWDQDNYCPQITDYGEIAFTPGFSAPETYQGNTHQFGQEVDVYSIGKILSLGESSLGPASRAIIVKATQPDPTERYERLVDLRIDLAAAFTTVTGLEPPEIKGPRAPSIGHVMGRAVFFRERGQFDEALRILMAEVEAGTAMEQLYAAIGNIHYRRKDLTEACEWFRRALALNPAFAPALASLAAPGMGTESERKRGLEILMRIAPHFRGTRVSWANILVEQGDLDSAEAVMEEARRSDPDDLDAILATALFYAHTRVDHVKAKAAFTETWNQWKPKSWDESRNVAMGAAAIGMCNILFAEQDFQNLGLWARRARRFPAMKAHAILFLANVANAEGETEKAKQMFERVKREYPDVINAIMQANHSP